MRTAHETADVVKWDAAMKRIARLEHENEVLRQSWTPPAAIAQREGHWVFLDAYEVANLTSALQAIQEGTGSSSLGVLNSGDWLGQIRNKLPMILSHPNYTPSEYVHKAQRWARGI